MRQGHLQIAKHYKRKSKNGRTAKHPWSRTWQQKAVPIASSPVHDHPKKAKPDSEPKILCNKDILDNDSSAVGDKHKTIVSESTLDIDGKTCTLTNGRADATIIRRENPHHSQTTTLNGREYLGRANMIKNNPCTNDSG